MSQWLILRKRFFCELYLPDPFTRHGVKVTVAHKDPKGHGVHSNEVLVFSDLSSSLKANFLIVLIVYVSIIQE